MRGERRRTATCDQIRGELVSFTVKGSDFWGVGTVRTAHDGGDVAITGKLLGVHCGDTVALEGVWAESKWGKQFRVTACQVMLPADASGVVGWLATTFPQVSRRRAEVLVERHGVEGVWAVLDAGDVRALCEVDGITPDRARAIVEVYRARKGERDRMVRFKGWGLTDSQIARLVQEWGDEAEARLTGNPYDLMEAVSGFGWKRADEVAQRMGTPHDSPARIAAGILHFVGEATAAGHCFVTSGKIAAVVARKVCGVPESAVRRELERLVEAGRLARDTGGGGGGANVYLPRIAAAESGLAKAICSRAPKGGRDHG